MFAAIIFLVIGLILLSISIYILFRYRTLTKIGIEVDGIIFDFEDHNSISSNLKYPIVRFTTDSHDWITHRYKIGLTPGIYKKGEKVKVLYNPHKPHDFFIKSPIIYFIILFLAFVALVFIAVGMFSL